MEIWVCGYELISESPRSLGFASGLDLHASLHDYIVTQDLEEFHFWNKSVPFGALGLGGADWVSEDSNHWGDNNNLI